MRRILLVLAGLSFLTSCGRVDIHGDPESYRKYWQGSSLEQTEPVLNPQIDGRKAEQIAALTAEIQQLFEAGKYDQVRVKVLSLLELDATNATAWYDLARVHGLQGRIDLGIHALQEAIRSGYSDADGMSTDPDLESLRSQREFGRLVAQARGNEKTQEMARQKVQRELSDLNRRMMAAFQKSRYSEARGLARRILNLQPESSTAWYNLACAESRLNDSDAALAALETAIEKGYLSFRHMENDPDLAGIRGHERFRRLLERKDGLLRSKAEQILVSLREELGDDYLFDIDHEQRLVFATNTDRRMLDELKQYLGTYAEVQRKALFTHKFEQYVTVILPREWKMRGVGGLYNPRSRTLTARSLGMVMTHEFTHALHFGDQEGRSQQHPIWITEGLATLFETSKMDGGTVTPQPNYRLLMLQQRARRGSIIPFKQLFGLSHQQFMRQASQAYAQSRYILMYLAEQGKLRAFYDTYTDGYEDDATGTAALEKVLGKGLEDIEADWSKWVLTQEAPPLRIRPNQAYLGVRMAPVKDGLEVVDIVPGSGADASGLQTGDVIVKVDGDRVVDSSDLLNIVTASDVGDTLRVEIRRDGEYKTIEVKLGAMPEQIPSSRAPTPRRSSGGSVAPGK